MNAHVPLNSADYDDPLSSTGFMTPNSGSDSEDKATRRPLRPSQGVAAGLPLICNGKGVVGLGAFDPPPWNPAKRIITFMGIVCLICTLIVIGIVLVAFYLSHNGIIKITDPNYRPFEVFYVIPQPRKLEENRAKTLVVNLNTQDQLLRQVNELSSLLNAYDKTNNSNRSSSNGVCPLCHFPWHRRVDQNCSLGTHFGYPAGSPCVALIFHVVPGWTPIPFDKETADLVLPKEIRNVYDPELVFLTCQVNGSKDTQIAYSPFQGYPRFFFNAGARDALPPLVMLRFSRVPVGRPILVSCYLWAKNVARSETALVPGKLTFNLFIS